MEDAGIMSRKFNKQTPHGLGRAALAFLLAISLCGTCGPAHAQPPPQTPPSPQSPAQPPDKDEELIRVSAELVQTGVSVTDNRGKFVDGLRAEDFELLVDGIVQPVTFFERVTTGSAREGATSPPAQRTAAPPAADITGRTVLFYVDDLHLAPDSLLRARSLLLDYVEREMNAGDWAAFAAASGQIGFLQQLTDNKAVLRAAAARLSTRRPGPLDGERPPMTVYQALAVERNDSSVIDYYVAFLLSEMFAGLRKTNAARARSSAEPLVHARARRILAHSDLVQIRTLAALENFVRSAAALPGRKLALFISDGFFLNEQRPDTADRLRHITDAATRAGVVIYTLQASGLGTAFPDAASGVSLGPDGSTGGAPLGEDTAAQAPLVQLAADTGGRALLNSNDLVRGVTQALAETGRYYLLAWRPTPELFRERKFRRIEVRVRGRADLTARLQRGFFTEGAVQGPAAQKNLAQSPPAKLDATAGTAQSRGVLVTHLAASFLDTPQRGPVLSLLLQVPGEQSAGARGAREYDVAGIVYNEAGKQVGSFTERLGGATGSGPVGVVYYTQLSVQPGLYQVRAAARDRATGATGRAAQWIEVPDLATGRLALSSLLLGERAGTADSRAASAAELTSKAQVKIDARFTRSARLRFLTYIYNAARAGGRQPRLEVQAELWRDNRQIVSTRPRAVETAGADDLARIPHAEELTLAALPSGRYRLRLTVFDRIAQTSATQEARFEIE